MTNTNTQEIQVPATMPYEEARQGLIQVVQQLESGQAPLEDSLALWERGEALAQHCQNILNQAAQKVEAAQARQQPQQPQPQQTQQQAAPQNQEPPFNTPGF